MKQRAFACAQAWISGLTMIAMLAGCGGGGGDGGSTSPAPATPPSTSTGLVPAPAAVGAVLYEQAQLLRPMRDGAVWVYRDQDHTTAIAATESRTTQSARTGGVFRETDSDDASNPTDVRIAANGDVTLSATLTLAPGAATINLVDAVELKSPVRVGDQMVLVDQRLVKSGLDADKDGKEDAVDVALWRTIAGKEAVTLPARTAPVEALRVDSTFVFRIIPSAGGAAQTTTLSSSAWYAPNIGLIRQAVKSGGSTRAWDSEQTLLGYDGGDRGFGYVAAASGAGTATRTVDQPLVLPQAIVVADAKGMTLLDFKGNRKAVQPSLGGFKQFGATSTSAWARVERAVNSNTERHDFYRLGADGMPEASPFMTLDPLDLAPAGSYNSSARFVSASGGSLIWTYFVRTNVLEGSGAFNEIVLRRHDLQNWVGGEVKLAVTDLLHGENSISVLAQPDGLWVTWSEYDTSAQQKRHIARVLADGSVAAHRVLPLSSLMVEYAPEWRLVGTGTEQWALWWGRGPAGTASVHGVRLDAAGNPVDTPASAAALTAAELPAFSSLTSPLAVHQSLGVTAAAWTFAADSHGLVYPDDGLAQAFIDVRQMEPGSGAPAATLKTVARYRLAGRYLGSPPIVFDRYTLLLTSVSPVIVWH